MKFFEHCTNLDELKRAYKAAAMKHHPDMGGDVETMKRINNEYERAFEVLKDRQNTAAAADTTGKTKATTESAGDFMAIINALLNLEGLEVELCGRWLWIGGDTMRHREALKAAGCKWSPNKKLWSWHFAEDGDTWHRGKRTMQQIRNRYGSTMYTKGNAAEREALPA